MQEIKNGIDRTHLYRNLYIPHSNSSLSTSLENIPAGIYELTITDEKGILAGEFIYEN